jgi:hypothetical protein
MTCSFDDLRDQWQAANAPVLDNERRDEAVLGICRRIERWNSAVLRRDIIETVVGVFGIAFFALYLYTHPQRLNWTVITGLVILFVSTVYIIYKLHHTRRFGQSKRIDLSLHEYLQQEVAAVDRQIELMRTVVWWYLTPIMVGCVIFYYGKTESIQESAAYAAAGILLGWIINWLNQRAVKKRLVPQRDALKELLGELEKEEET